MSLAETIISDVRLGELTDEICDLLVDRDIPHRKGTVSKLVDRWYKAKKELIGLLSCHPNWSEDDLAVRDKILVLQETGYAQARENLLLYLDGSISHLPLSKRRVASLVFQALTDASGETATAEACEVINNLRDIPINLRPGQKFSRYMRLVMKVLELDDHSTFEKHFNVVSTYFNKKEVEVQCLLSVHPMDYLLISHGSWTSCHDIRSDKRSDGEFCAGNLSYMGDGVTTIFYTSSLDAKTPRSENKIMRQIHFLSPRHILQSKVYPASSDSRYSLSVRYGEWVTDVYNTCAGQDVEWVRQRVLLDYVTNHSQSKHYSDYKRSANNCCSYVPKDCMATSIEIGSGAHCLVCDRVMSNSGALACCSDDEIRCHSCDRWVRTRYARELDGEYYCEHCVRECDWCESMFRRSDVVSLLDYENTSADYEFVCHRCLEQSPVQCCVECGGYFTNVPSDALGSAAWICPDCPEADYDEYDDEEYDDYEDDDSSWPCPDSVETEGDE